MDGEARGGLVGAPIELVESVPARLRITTHPHTPAARSIWRAALTSEYTYATTRTLADERAGELIHGRTEREQHPRQTNSSV